MRAWGAVVLVAAALVDPDLYRRYWRAIFVGTSVVIAFVLLVGHAAHGSTRWINLGFFTFQPSEFGKLLFVLALAGMLAERQRAMTAVGDDAEGRRVRPLPVLLVFAQPDLGTALVYFAALAAMLFVAGTPWRHLAVLGGASCSRGRRPVGRPAAGVSVLKSYQQQRLTCFIAFPDVLGRRRVQPRAVEDGGRLRPDPRPRPERRDARSTSASCRRAGRTSSSPASPSSEASSVP